MSGHLLRVFLVAVLVVVPCTHGQTPTDLNEGSKVEWDATNEIWRLKWWGQSGHTYFIQHSEDPREPWQWFPVIESGNDSVREWGFTTSGDRFFVRLRHTDIATSDPENDDFDGDGLSNMQELLLGTDPFNADTDGDDLSDLLELASGANPAAPGQSGGSVGLFVYLGGDR